MFILDSGTEPSERWAEVEQRRPSLWIGHNEWWLAKRSGRWFLMHHYHDSNCNETALFRVENPGLDNLYIDGNGDLRGFERWTGYQGDEDNLRPDAIW